MDYRLLIPKDLGFYLEGFRKASYPERFADYCALAGDEIQAASCSDAQQLCAWMDAQVKGLFKGRQRLDQAMLLMQYTVPAAIRLGRDDFAKAVQDAWGCSHPANAFGIGTYEEFYASFNTTLLGFKIEKKDDKA